MSLKRIFANSGDPDQTSLCGVWSGSTRFVHLYVKRFHSGLIFLFYFDIILYFITCVQSLCLKCNKIWLLISSSILWAFSWCFLLIGVYDRTSSESVPLLLANPCKQVRLFLFGNLVKEYELLLCMNKLPNVDCLTNIDCFDYSPEQCRV